MASALDMTSLDDSSRFTSLFEGALKEYHEHTGTDLASHPLYDRLNACGSAETVIDAVKEQARAFGEYRKGDRATQLMTKLSPLVDTMLVLNDGLGKTIGEVFKPAKLVCAGVGLLLRASKGVSESYDSLVDLFDTMSRFLERVKVYTRVKPTPSMTEIIVKMMIGMLDILGLATKEIKQGRLRAFGKKLMGSRKIEDVVKRLDRLTLEESRMSTTHILLVVHTLLEEFKGVMTGAETSTATYEEALASIQQIVDDVNKIKRDLLHQKCTKWLSPPDPFSNHAAKRKQCHRGSTDWFIHGNAFGEWTASERSFLWLHGKPGSGKSVLCSAIVDHCVHHLRRTGLGTVVFFYCDFQDSAKQSLDGILRSFLVQLCQQSDSYSEILSRFRTENKGHLPNTDALGQCLEAMLALPNEAPKYIFVDGLDECPNSGMQPPRDAILSFLNDVIVSHFSDVHICITSRPEGDIRGVLKHGPASFHVSLEEEIGQEHSIVNYVVSSVESHPKMRQWSKTVQDLVIDTLKYNAHGMFRYVYCQLNELCDLHPADIPEKLKTLPKTLYETYESTLQRIPEGSWELAHRIFQCVSFSQRPFQVEELAELLAFDFRGDTPAYHSDWRAEDVQQALLTFCPGSFLSIVKTRRGSDVRFAHSSVREFLTSTIIANSTARISRFHVLPRPSHTLLAQICLTALLQVDVTSSRDTLSKDLHLLRYAASHWDVHARFESVALSVMDLATKVLDPARPHSVAWLSQEGRFPGELASFTPTSRLGGTTLYFAALCGLPLVVEQLVVSHPEDLDQIGGHHGTPLNVASHYGHIDTVRLLLDHGADPNAPASPTGPALYVASFAGHVDVVQLLLEHRAQTQSPWMNTVLRP
ncbi:hypothetical protein BC834DRAFT_1044836 [Gloeopeniophorella convolvens]|nr:hypothetical protein BC834DRAFT_1044836 [Gloeopeniophorella convolvens]